ncbi:Sec-independent protein translocase protein TatB [Cereibacter changlensis]|uniref:Sec-independent protein translocase protein TatB n=1 Tax=Cereibacter changlensis TaxID=402884 RepID=UPI00403317BA
MFDIGWSELMVIGVVALIVIGPKDLPEMFRTLGRFTAKARSMAREFQRAMEAAADDTGLKDVAKDVKNATSAKSMGLDAVKDAATKFEAWDPMKSRPTLPKGPATQALADAQAAKTATAAANAGTAPKPPVPASVPTPEAAAPETPAAPQPAEPPKGDA